MTDLGIDADDLASCVSCGLCLSQCPTFRVTGEEALSPRGRITTMRSVQRGDRPFDADAMASISTCVQCRACETACPSGVPYGRLIEPARTAVARAQPRWRSAATSLLLAPLGHHRLLLAGSTLLAAAQRLGIVPDRPGIPRRLPVRRPRLVPTGTDAWLLTGCVMDAWERQVHDQVLRVAGALGAGVGLLDARAGAACCGALHLHQGLDGRGRQLLAETIAAAPPNGPILTDVAGCGAVLGESGALLGTPEAERFASRVVDVHGWLLERLEESAVRHPLDRPVVVLDPCHLRHVQRGHEAVHELLRRCGAKVVVLDDEGLCCGAGGAYAAFEPDLAGRIRQRKVAAIDRAAGRGGGSSMPIVAVANAGCGFHLRAAGVEVVHPISLVAEALGV